MIQLKKRKRKSQHAITMIYTGLISLTVWREAICKGQKNLYESFTYCKYERPRCCNTGPSNSDFCSL